MNILGDKKLDCSIIAETLSHSGKYRVFFGVHYVRGITCWDVGAYNKDTGLVTRRHYADKPSAFIFWNTFREGMLRPPISELSDETDLLEEV